ncbi:MAG TPA: matrixin family metalloprotease [Gaiellaceae bacterium]|nr:matrixin family metalloprotease [Gaiellaceae bacterium]
MTRALGLAAVLAVLLPAGPASAYAVQGKAWPGGRILYYNAAPDQAWAVQQAVDAWNASGAAIRFVPSAEASAQVVIREFARSECTSTGASVGGEAALGYVAHSVVFVTRLDPATAKCNQFSAAQTLAHELGHVLGLGHEAKVCAAMNRSGSLRGPSLCRQAPLGVWSCSLLEPDDVAGAVAMYGGAGRTRSARWCPLYQPIASPARLGLAGSGVPGGVTASFVRPPDPVLPPFLRAYAGRAGFAAAVRRDACPVTDAGSTRTAWSAAPGGVQTTVFGALGPGRWCVSVWPYDQLGRRGPRTFSWIRMV